VLVHTVAVAVSGLIIKPGTTPADRGDALPAACPSCRPLVRRRYRSSACFPPGWWFPADIDFVIMLSLRGGMSASSSRCRGGGECRRFPGPV